MIIVLLLPSQETLQNCEGYLWLEAILLNLSEPLYLHFNGMSENVWIYQEFHDFHIHINVSIGAAKVNFLAARSPSVTSCIRPVTIILLWDPMSVDYI